jgi:hypothetical protein
MTTYKEIVEGFKPQFGNANHIAAVAHGFKSYRIVQKVETLAML